MAVSTLLRPLGHEPRRRWGVPATLLLGASILVALYARSAGQVQVWRDSVTLWEDCLRLIPANAFAHASGIQFPKLFIRHVRAHDRHAARLSAGCL